MTAGPAPPGPGPPRAVDADVIWPGRVWVDAEQPGPGRPAIDAEVIDPETGLPVEEHAA
jgi:hypothetical protein